MGLGGGVIIPCEPSVCRIILKHHSLSLNFVASGFHAYMYKYGKSLIASFMVFSMLCNTSSSLTRPVWYRISVPAMTDSNDAISGRCRQSTKLYIESSRRPRNCLSISFTQSPSETIYHRSSERISCGSTKICNADVCTKGQRVRPASRCSVELVTAAVYGRTYVSVNSTTSHVRAIKL